jgi:CRP/FNR family transcriptional regulator, dissimilatory nitrate respiration regulator
MMEYLNGLGTEISALKGEILFLEGMPASKFFHIKEGEIRIYKVDSEGKELEVSRLQSGAFVGEAVMFSHGVYPVTSQVIKPSKLIRFDKKVMVQAIENNQKLAMFFIQLLAKKCIRLNSRLEMLTLHTVRVRLISFLLENKSPESDELVLKLKKTELAKQIGTISETLSRNLARLQKDGLISMNNHQIRLLDLPALRSELP